MKKQLALLIITLPLLMLAAIELNQSNGVLSGEGHARTHDFEVTAKTFNLDIGDLNENGTRQINVSIPVKDMDTGISMRNIHMRSSMFNTKEYPDITFSASTDANLSPGKILLSGTLSINGISRPHDLTVNLSNVSGELVAEGETTITPTNFDLPLVGMGPMKVLDEVNMSFKVVVSKN